MRLGTISELWRFPVKSMGGERLGAATLSVRGIPGDRGWAVYDEARAGITTGKRVHALRSCRARYASEPVAGEGSPPVEITFADGSTTRTDAPDITPRMCALAGRAVSLHALGPAGTEATPRVNSAADSPETARALMGILPGETEPDYSMFTPEGLRALRQGNFFDAFALHLISRTTLRTLKDIAPESDWDERRFRANIVMDAVATDGYPEQAWVGKKLRVGKAVLDVMMGCPRCVMVTLAGDGLPRDHQIMRTLVRETKHIAGVYMRVAVAGDVRVGDAIEWAE